ncbi:MAG TPA: pyridoxamine 5'-phosphate oxidase family protein [Solirubrobacteraceae bacterium]|nr:pyridoxamine 5'-phosphate oxidase family protein [Solirubrobacteraceae bacterium]
MIDDASAQRLRSTPVAWLTTVRADGQPQSSYVWFHYDGDDIVLLSEPKTQKVRNIGNNPKVAFNLDGNTVTGDGVLTMEAIAEIVGGMPSDRWTAYLTKYETRMRKGPWGSPDGFNDVFSLAIRLVPGRVRAW